MTTFPNIKVNQNKEQIQFQSYHYNIFTDFPIEIGPLSRIQIYAHNNYFNIYVNNPKNIFILKKSPKWILDFSSYRIFLTRKILSLYSKSGAFVIALVLGNKYFLNNDFIEYVRASGLSHLFALSGLHLVIFVGIFLFIGYLFGISRRMLSILTIPISFFYLLLGGMGISLQRAFLFHILWAFSEVLRLSIPIYRIYFLALIVHLILMPSAIFSISFILSYLSVIGIVFFYKFWYDMIRKYIGSFISSYLAVSLAVMTLITPILILFFKMVNIWSIFSSLFIVPIMPLVLFLCFSVLIFASLDIYISILDNILFFCYHFIYKLAEFFSTLPYGVIFFSYPEIGAFIITVVIFFLILIIKRIKYDSKA